jgi:hypothetical protein
LRARIGQTLEIAVYRARAQGSELDFFGRFKDLEEHSDDQLYSKEEPPQHIRNLALEGDERLDFLLRASSGVWLGVECKNIRE